MGKKQDKNPREEEGDQEPENQEEQIFDRVAAKLTQTFEAKFDKFEKLMEKMTAVQRSPSPDPKGTKRPATNTINPHDTRNKALRSQYNPSMRSVVNKVSDLGGQQTITHPDFQAAGTSHQQSPDDETLIELSAQAHCQSQNVNIRPALVQTVTGGMAPVLVDKNKGMNQWLINQAAALQPTFSSAQLPTSVRDFHDDDDLDSRVQALLATSASNIARGNPTRPGLFPFKYVFRGEDSKKVTMNSLSISDHCWAIFRMIRDESVPADIKPYLLTHVEQVLEDTREYSWHNAVRPWSNQVFSRVAEGRFAHGWASTHEIQLLRISISQTSTAKLANTTNDHQGTGRQHQLAQANDQMRGGPPCMSYNSQRGCQLPSGHIVNGQKLVHICAYCLFNASATRQHPEFFCRNKQRANIAGNHF